MKKIFLTICLVILFSVLLSGGTAKATDNLMTDIQGGIDKAAKSAGITKLKMAKMDPVGVVANIIGIALSFIGVIFFLLMLYAGIMWMTAMGHSERVETAKDILEASLIGLVIVLSAYAITSFVFKNIIGVTPKGGSAVVAEPGEEACVNFGGKCILKEDACKDASIFSEGLCKGKFTSIEGSGCCIPPNIDDLEAEGVKSAS